MNRITGGTPALDLADVEREVVARDREIANPFTKDLADHRDPRRPQLPRRQADPGRRAAPAARPRGRPADRRPAERAHPQDPRRAGDRPVGPGAAPRRRASSRACTRPVRSPASAAAACTATARSRAPSSGGCLFSGRVAGRAAGGRAVSGRAAASPDRTRRPPGDARTPATSDGASPPYGAAGRTGHAARTAATRATAPRPTAIRGALGLRAAAAARGGRARSSPPPCCPSSRPGSSWSRPLYALVRSSSVAGLAAAARRTARSTGATAGRRGHRARRRPAAVGRRCSSSAASSRSAARTRPRLACSCSPPRRAGRARRLLGGPAARRCSSDLPGRGPGGGFAAFTLVFAACPLVALGLVLFARRGGRWFDGTRRAADAAARHTGRHADAPPSDGRPDRSAPPRSGVAALLRRDPAGLVAAVVQQHDTGEVLMVAWMDDEALHRTLTTGRATYWSRSRRRVLGQGRDLGQPAVGARRAGGLRRRRAARARRPGGPGLPHRRAQLLLPRAAAVPGAAREARRTSPARAEFAALDQPVVPVTRRLLADSETAVGVYRKLAGNRPGTVLLESAEQGKQWSRYSFVGVRSAGVLTERGRRHRSGSASPCPGSPTTCRPIRWPPSARWPAGCARRARADLPPLTGGLVGYLGYDVVRRLERLPATAHRRPRHARAGDDAGHRPGRARPHRRHRAADRQRVRAATAGGPTTTPSPGSTPWPPT